MNNLCSCVSRGNIDTQVSYSEVIRDKLIAFRGMQLPLASASSVLHAVNPSGVYSGPLASCARDLRCTARQGPVASFLVWFRGISLSRQRCLFESH